MTNDLINQGRRGLIPEDLLKFRWLSDLALDPSGARIAYTVRRPDVASNGYVTQLYVRELATGDTKRLTGEDGNASALAWSRDGGRLAYAWSASGKNAVRIYRVAEGAETTYPLSGAGMSGLDWSADGKKLVGVRWTSMRHPQDQGARPGLPAPTLKVIRRLRYKIDGVGWIHDRFTQIWVLELQSGDLVQITDSEIDYSEPSWSLHGNRLAFIGLAREQNTELGQGQLFIYDYPHGTPQRLMPDWQGACRSPSWGDEDRSIAFAGHNYPAPVNRRRFMVPYVVEVATGSARLLASEIDQEVGNYAVADQRAGLSNITIRWAKGDPWIYFLLTEAGAVSLCRVNTKGHFERVIQGKSVVFEYSPIAGDRVLYGIADPSNPGDLCLWQKGTSERLTALNPWLRDHELVLPEEYWYDGVDGTKVHAWLLKPPNFDPNKRYPAILQVHCSMFSWDFCHEFQSQAQAGFVVAYFNQRGTTAGYGQTWTAASEGDQGGKDYEEIMLGLEDLLQRCPNIDPARLGVTGGSCGGLMTNFIVGKSDRFAAAVTQRSISNQISFFGSADIGPECTLGETSDTPWSNLESLWRQSPIAYAEQIHTPLLILHSDEDHRCPLEQAEQLFAILRWLGREVELLIFEGEDHSLSRGGRPGNRIERLRRIEGWFERYLKEIRD